MTGQIDLVAFNIILAVIIGIEAVFVLVLRISRPRASSRSQALVGMMALAAFGALGFVSASVHVFDGLGPVALWFTFLMRVSIFVLLTTFIWHEWKENGHHKRQSGGDQ